MNFNLTKIVYYITKKITSEKIFPSIGWGYTLNYWIDNYCPIYKMPITA